MASGDTLALNFFGLALNFLATTTAIAVCVKLAMRRAARAARIFFHIQAQFAQVLQMHQACILQERGGRMRFHAASKCLGQENPLAPYIAADLRRRQERRDGAERQPQSIRAVSVGGAHEVDTASRHYKELLKPKIWDKENNRRGPFRQYLKDGTVKDFSASGRLLPKGDMTIALDREEDDSGISRWRSRAGQLAALLQARFRRKRRSTKMSTTRRHYTIEDIDEALEDQRAQLAIWRCEALRELRACLLAQDGQSPKRSAGATVEWKTRRKQTTGVANAIA
jgi:hypothetical protein